MKAVERKEQQVALVADCLACAAEGQWIVHPGEKYLGVAVAIELDPHGLLFSQSVLIDPIEELAGHFCDGRSVPVDGIGTGKVL